MPYPLTFVVPGRLDAPTGGSVYDRRMVDALRRHHRPVDVVELDASFPHPTAAALDQAAQVLAAVPAGAIVVIDGLALGAMPAIAEREASRIRIVALVHLPLAEEVGLDHDTASRLRTSERRALGAASMVVVTGRATLDLLAPYGVPADRILLVEPGTDHAPVARGSGARDVQLLSVATISPGKGHEVLVQALAAVPNRQWRLVCAGSLSRHPATVARVRLAVHDHGFEDCVSLVGELEGVGLAESYDRADLFVLPTLRETYGLAVAEALARGLPVVSTTTGAIPGLVGDDAGLLVPPGDADALAVALTRVIEDEQLRGRLARGARRVRASLHDWEHSARRLAAGLERLDTHG